MLKEDNKVVLPSGSFKCGRKALDILFDLESLHRDNFIELMGLSKSVLSNNLPILKDLELIRYFGFRNSHIAITDKGKQLIILTQDIETHAELRFLSESLIKKSMGLTAAYNLLNENNNLTFSELGHGLAKKFGKTWKHELTYSHIGRSCVDYLIGLNLLPGDGVNGKQRKNQIFKPILSASAIIENIKKYPASKRFPIYTHLDTPGVKARRLAEANTLISLKLLNKIDENNYELTSLGIRLKKAINTPNENRVFSDILTENSHVINLINILQENYEKIDRMNIGSVLEEYNGANWSEITVKWYGGRFLSWLKFAGFVEQNHEYGKYMMFGVPSSQTKIPSSTENKLKPTVSVKMVSSPNTKSNNSYITLLQFSQHLNKILVELDNWDQDLALKKDMLITLRKMGESNINGSENQIIIDQLKFLVEKGFENKDITFMRNIARTLNKLIDNKKHRVTTSM